MAETIHGTFFGTAVRYHDKVALRYPGGGRRARLTYAQLDEWVAAAADRLRSLGVGKGDVVGILSRNRPQWVIADLAALSLGAAVVPLYPTLPVTYLQYIINDSGMKLLMAGDSDLLGALGDGDEETPKLQGTLLLDKAVIEAGPEAFRAGGSGSHGRDTGGDAGISGDDVATIVYTSGTTGAPKGVILTHSNIVSNARALTARYGICADDSVVSYLPLSHMFERTCGYYTFLFAGATISYAEDIMSIQKAVLEAHPTVIIAVPRVLEKAHAAARWKIAGDSSKKKALVANAIRDLNDIANRRYRGERISPWLALKAAVYDRLVAKKFRDAAGGRLRIVVSGGASLDKLVAKTLFVVGFQILEGYGMTEAAPVIACNPIDGIRLGSVGRPLEGVEVRIGDNSEILVRGPNVMKGYLGRPEETAEALDADGWLHTGDQGKLDDDGYLTITGRLKDLIVTSYGKNISPRLIEEKMARSELVSQVMVYGDNRKYLIALVVPDENVVRTFAKENGLPADDYAALLKTKEIHDLVGKEVARVNEGAASYEQIRAFDVLPEPFSLENGMLTPTLKPRRGRISMLHEDIIEALYHRIEAHGGGN